MSKKNTREECLMINDRVCPECNDTGIVWELDKDGYGDIEEPKTCSKC